MVDRTIAGTVFEVSRFRVDDGPGVRTAVFVKGCPLRCAWCHNPESNRAEPELSFDETRCIACGACVSACDEGCHRLGADGSHEIDRSRCLACGACEAACPVDALRIIGRRMSVAEVMSEVVRDRPFYAASGGGLTVSGGEPLGHLAFTRALLAAAREDGIGTCIETSGYGDIGAVAELLDCALYDCKAVDTRLHQRLTGVRNERILDNLRLLNDCGVPIVLRFPAIPGMNVGEENLIATGRLAERLPSVEGVEVMPYHPLGIAKGDNLGRPLPYRRAEFADADDVEDWMAVIRSATSKPVYSANS